MSLLREYGVDEFSTRICGATVKYNDKIHLLRSVNTDDNVISTYQLEVDKDLNTVTEPSHIPATFFSSLKSIEYPTLGWRITDAGKFATFLYREPSMTKKGLHAKSIVNKPSNLSLYLREYCHYDYSKFLGANASAYLAWNPEFTPLEEGIRKMREGAIISFAIDHNFAVMPKPDSQELDILYKNKQVGYISEKNEVRFTMKWVNKVFDSCIKNFGN